MWIMTSYGVLMPADLPVKHQLPNKPEWDMQIRARDRKTLVELRKRMAASGLDTSRIIDTRHMDYEYRIYVNRFTFAGFMFDELIEIDYVKFKPTTGNTKRGHRLHHLYNHLWYVIAKHYESAVLYDPLTRS